MKKLFVLLIAFILALSCFSCGEYDYTYSEVTSSEKVLLTSTQEPFDDISSIEEISSEEISSKEESSSKEVSSKEESSSKEVSSKEVSSEQVKESVTERMVWIPKSGKKYHQNPSCSNMNNPSQVTISRAESLGYTPCKKCY
jgi:hypothetical protein